MLHTGMDMHKKYSVVTVTDDDGNELLTGRRLNNDEQEIVGFIEEFDQEMKVVLEAGSNCYWMCDLLGMSVRIAGLCRVETIIFGIG